jgi:hypothetical protein
MVWLAMGASRAEPCGNFDDPGPAKNQMGLRHILRANHCHYLSTVYGTVRHEVRQWVRQAAACAYQPNDSIHSLVSVSHDVPRMPRAGSKLAILAEFLAREEDATIEEMMGDGMAGALSPRRLERRAGEEVRVGIASEKVEGRGRVYHA